MTFDGRQKGRGKQKDSPENRLKYEIARELGLGDKVNEKGWGGLTTAETGRIGGIITTRKKAQNRKNYC